MKFTTKLKPLYVLAIAFMFTNAISAQEIIEEAKAEETSTLTDSVKPFTVQKVDGVAAVVGDYIILDSDVPKARVQIEASGFSTKDISDCELLGKQLEDKLYAHHAIQDSIVVSDSEIRAYVDQQIERFKQQFNGSLDEVLEFYKKEDEKSLRDEMFEINKSTQLAQRMQAKIVEEVEITPDEVREFFNKIPEEERPTFGTELKVSQIVIEPKISQAEKQKVIDRLKEFKEDVVNNGASFRSKAVLYSEDPGSRGNGGRYTLNRKQPRMVKEFRDVAFSLQEGEVSEPFETDFGFHIVTLEKIRGQEYDVAHILLMPKVTNDAVKEAKDELEKIRQRIVDEELTFEEAAREFSDEKETRSEGGKLINPATQDYNFELTKMDPELYGLIQDLKDNEVSLVRTDQDRTGKIKFKILTVSDRVEDHEADFAKDYLKIKELALNEKRLKAIEKWQTEKIMDTYIKISDGYRDCDFSGNWLKQ